MDVKFQIHWLTVSFRGDLKNIKVMVDRMLDCESEHSEVGGMGYNLSIRYINGAVWFWDPELNHATLRVTGMACEVIETSVLVELMGLARESGGRVTRIDLAFDNLDFKPSELWECVKSGNVVTKANRDSFRFQQSLDGLNDTVMIGSRSSERYLRVYNRRGTTRVELELKDMQAMVASSSLVSASDVSLISRRIVRHFLEVGQSFWDFFSTVEPLNTVVRHISDVVYEKLVRWIVNQVSSALAALDRIDDSLVVTILDCGSSRKSFSRYVAALSSA